MPAPLRITKTGAKGADHEIQSSVDCSVFCHLTTLKMSLVNPRLPAAQGNDSQESGSFLTRTGNCQRKNFFEFFQVQGKNEALFSYIIIEADNLRRPESRGRER